MVYIFLFILIAVAIFVFYKRLGKPDNYSGPRDTIYFGYYGDMAFQYDEVKDHVNTVWIAAWDRYPHSWADTVFDRVTQASRDGKKSVVMMTNDTYIDGRLNYRALTELDTLFSGLDKVNALKDVVAVYPVDEPDGAGLSDEEIAKTNNAIRDVMRKYPVLKTTALAVFYTGSEKYNGLPYYDWVGFDEYNAGERAIGAKYRRMVEKLNSRQRTMIIPGGCDKWRQDPRPFVDFALNNPRVVAVVPFIWIDNAAEGNPDVGLGIRSNGLKPLYKEAGKDLVG